MPKKTGKKIYTDYPWPEDAPMGLGKTIDLLPSPDQLVFKEKKEKITLELNQRSVNFFRKHARRRRVPYQAMIRALLDEYVNRAEQ